jgi:hypothetical protein
MGIYLGRFICDFIGGFVGAEIFGITKFAGIIGLIVNEVFFLRDWLMDRGVQRAASFWVNTWIRFSLFQKQGK